MPQVTLEIQSLSEHHPRPAAYFQNALNSMVPGSVVLLTRWKWGNVAPGAPLNDCMNQGVGLTFTYTMGSARLP